MAGTSKTRKPKKAKNNELLSKPKRPKSAYNFFFRAERANILSEVSSNGEAPPSFQDIGRIIGERWGNTEDGARAEYKKLAKIDNVRYKNEMERFYEDQRALMCRGLLSVSSPKVTAAPLAAQLDRDPQVTDLGQQHQMLTTHASRNGSMNTFQNERSICGGATHPETAPSTNDDQVFQLLLQHQQSAASSAPNTSIMQLILTQKSSIQQRQQILNEEMSTLQLKGSLLETMLATEVSKRQRNTVVGNTPLVSDGLGSVDRQPIEQLSQLLQTQKVAVTENRAALRSQISTNGQPFSAMVANPAPSMQGLNNNPPPFPHFMPASSSMNCVPNSNITSMANAGGNSMSVEELIRMHNVMNGGQ